MRIVVIGGTGLIGSKLVATLRERGHDAVPAAPNTGVNTVTREGPAAALDAAVLNFFRTSTGNILAAEAGAGVPHHVALSVVGSERLPAAA